MADDRAGDHLGHDEGIDIGADLAALDATSKHLFDEPASRPDGSPINRYTSTTPTAVMAGDVEPLPHWAGQGVGLVAREESAADIVHSLVTEAEEVLKLLA